MSDETVKDLRRFEPVPRLDWPARFSQTALRHAHDCRRSFYLYNRYRGGAPSVPMDRGTLAHAVFERMTMTLLEEGELAFLESEERQIIRKGVDPKTVAGQIAAVTAAIVDEVARENPQLPLPFGAIDAVREMAWHWAVGMDLNVEELIAIERKFVLDVGGRTISGRVDLALMNDEMVVVKDYKTSFNRQEQEAFEESFQTKLYSALIAFGRPVERVRCDECEGSGKFYSRETIAAEGGDDPDCAACDGRGSYEQLGEPLAGGINLFRGEELYPRFLRKSDGRIDYRSATRTRTELYDFLVDLERLLDELEERMAREEDEWPARAGSHCSMCPAQAECPLPPLARDLHGTIGSVEAAALFAEGIDRAEAELKAWKKELRSWLKGNGGRLRYGKDKVFVLEREGSMETNWPALELGIAEAVEFGAPFELADYRSEKGSLRMKSKTLPPEELEAERAQRDEEDGEDGRTDDERWGADAPW